MSAAFGAIVCPPACLPDAGPPGEGEANKSHSRGAPLLTSPWRGEVDCAQRNREGVTALTRARASGTAAHPTPRPSGATLPLQGRVKQTNPVLAMRFLFARPSYEQERMIPKSGHPVFGSDHAQKTKSQQNTSPQSRPSSDDPAVEGRIHHDRARQKEKNERKKRKQNAERRNFTSRPRTVAPTLLRFGRARIQRARTPSGVPLRLLSKGLTHPKDSAPDQASRSAAPVSGGVLPPAPAPVAASTSRAGHGAGRHDVRAAREPR